MSISAVSTPRSAVRPTRASPMRYTPQQGFNTVTTTTAPTTGSFHTHVTDLILRVGLNYRFGGPIVAKYQLAVRKCGAVEPSLGGYAL